MPFVQCQHEGKKITSRFFFDPHVLVELINSFFVGSYDLTKNMFQNCQIIWSLSHFYTILAYKWKYSRSISTNSWHDMSLSCFKIIVNKDLAMWLIVLVSLFFCHGFLHLHRIKAYHLVVLGKWKNKALLNSS